MTTRPSNPGGASKVRDASKVGSMTLSGDPMSDAAVARQAAQVLAGSSDAAFVMQVPSGLIVAASPTAAGLLDPGDADIVGRWLEDFTSDEPSGALALFSDGRIDGYESTRTLARPNAPGGLQVRLWFRRFDHQSTTRFALVLITAGEADDAGVDLGGAAEAAPIVGTVSSARLIEQISRGTADLFGCGPEQLLGQPASQLVHPDDNDKWNAAMSQASTGGQAVTLAVRAPGRAQPRDRDTRPIECDVLLLPLQPGLTFVFMPASQLLIHPLEVAGTRSMLMRLSQVAGVAHAERAKWSGLSERDLPGLEDLTPRERDMLSRLIAGYRVRSIASDLVLSPSTVRSHLASIFTKLGVSNQSDLISAVRAARPNLRWNELYSSWHDDSVG